MFNPGHQAAADLHLRPIEFGLQMSDNTFFILTRCPV